MKSEAIVTRRKGTPGFSLVEVVVALAIFVFAGFALIGLLSLVIHNNGDSKQQLQAATIAEEICSTRRAAPTATLANNFPLPPLSSTANSLSSPIGLTWDGVQTASLSAPNTRFGMIFNINPPAGYNAGWAPGEATVYLCIFWPPQASPTSASTSRFELTTSFLVP